MKAFLNDAESRVQPITLAFYRRLLDPFKQRHGDMKATALTPTLAEAFARKPTWSNSTRHDCRGTLATAFRWAERSRMVSRSPLIRLRLPSKESQGASAVMDADACRKVLEATSGDFHALLRFLWLTGCRPSEATTLTAEAVDWQSACIVLRNHKTAQKGRVRVIDRSPVALAVLEAQRYRHGTGLLFRNAGGRAWGRKHMANGVPDAQVGDIPVC